MRKTIFLFCFCLINVLNYSVKAQDASFTQFFANPLYLSPAMAGISKCSLTGLQYRNQWPQFNNAYITYSAFLSTYVNNFNSGLGVLAFRDEMGNSSITNTNLSVIYAYHVAVNKKLRISFGLQGTYNILETNFENLIFPDMIDTYSGHVTSETGEIISRNDNNKFWDFSSGIVSFTEYLYFGLSVNHLATVNNIETNENLILPGRKYTVFAGGDIPIGGKYSGSKFNISPNLLISKQLEHSLINYGLYSSWNSFTLGAWFKQNLGKKINSIAFLIGYFHKNIKFGYSYDYSLSKYGYYNGGSHEISLRYIFLCAKGNNKKTKYAPIPCPEF